MVQKPLPFLVLSLPLYRQVGQRGAKVDAVAAKDKGKRRIVRTFRRGWKITILRQRIFTAAIGTILQNIYFTHFHHLDLNYVHLECNFTKNFINSFVLNMRPSPPLVQHVIASFPSKCIACARKCKCMSSVFHFVLSFTPWESLLRACRMQQEFDIYPVRTTALCLCNGLHYNLVSRLPCARIYFRQPWWWRLYVTLWQPAWMSHITWQPADWISAHQDCVHSPLCVALPPFLADPWISIE